MWTAPLVDQSAARAPVIIQFPEHGVRRQGGGPARADDRAAFTAIVFVLTGGCARSTVRPKRTPGYRRPISLASSPESASASKASSSSPMGAVAAHVDVLGGGDVDRQLFAARMPSTCRLKHPRTRGVSPDSLPFPGTGLG